MYRKQIARLEEQLAIKNDITTATTLALRYWQASRFSNAPDHTLIQRANHISLSVYRRNASHGELCTLAIFIAIEAGHYDSANEMLDKAMGHKTFLRTNTPYQYAALCFLYAYLEINQNRTRSAKKYWRALTDHIRAIPHSEDYTIMQGLLHLASDEFEDAFICLRDAFRAGSDSIFLYEGLYRYYRTAPHSPDSGAILALLIYVAGRGVDISGLAMRHQTVLFNAISANPNAGEQLYALSGYPPLLEEICAHRISACDVSPAAYAYYKEAENKQIFTNGLYHAIVQASYENRINHVNHYTLAQFLKTAQMDAELAVYVYHLLLTTPSLATLLPDHQSRILQLAGDCIENNVTGREANSLYYYFWSRCKELGIEGPNLKKAEAILSEMLTSFELTAHPNVRYIYITEPEKRGMIVCDIQDTEPGGSIVIEATGQGLSYICLGAGQRTILDEKISIERMVPGASAELYQYFFDKGDRRFYLLTYLTNHYLQEAATPLPEGSGSGIYSRYSGGVYTDEVGDAKHRATRPVSAAYERVWGSAPLEEQAAVPDITIPVFESMLAEKAITKPFRMRILAALGQLHYNASNFDRALEYYGEVDEDISGFVEQILNVYMQTHKYERAAKLISAKHSCISGEILMDTICTLLTKPVSHAPLAEAAYQLLTNGFYCEEILILVLNYYDASYSEWVTLAGHIDIDTRIVETAIWMAQWDTHAQEAFVRLCNHNGDETLKLISQFVEYATYELLVNNVHPERETLSILEKHCLESSNTLLVWGLASCYLHHSITTFNSEQILALATHTLEDESILFPVFKENKFSRIPFIEKYQPFVHRGIPGKDYRLYYRIDDNPTFTSTPMRYIKYGIYVTCLPLFYNEEVTYYFSEETPTGSISTKMATIKNTTPFLFDHPTDQFFAINNALTYEQMFKYDQVEKAIGSIVKDVQVVRSKLL